MKHSCHRTTYVRSPAIVPGFVVSGTGDGCRRGGLGAVVMGSRLHRDDGMRGDGIPMPRSKGRTGRPWRRAAAKVKASSNVCWICGHQIDLLLPAKDPMSFTVDHVVPVSRGGPLRDVRYLRPAHRRCNSRRGNRVTFVALPPTSRRW